MKRVALSFVAAVFAVTALASTNCSDDSSSFSSQLCIRRASDFSAQTPTCPTGADAGPPSLSDGEGVVVIHELAENVDPTDLELTIQVETPCTTVQQQPTYYGRAAVALFVAPPGSSCALTVTSHVADEYIRISGPPPADAGACLGLDTVCKPAESDTASDAGDAGVDAD